MCTRRGTTIIELVAATVIMAALLSGASLAISRIVVQRQHLMQQTWATLATANVMEQIDSLPYAQLTELELDALALPADADAVLPSAVLRCTVDEVPQAAVPAKRVRVTLQWKGRVHGPPRQLQLVTWKYPLDRTQP